jgi:hypothetical protein
MSKHITPLQLLICDMQNLDSGRKRASGQEELVTTMNGWKIQNLIGGECFMAHKQKWIEILLSSSASHISISLHLSFSRSLVLCSLQHTVPHH